MLSLRPSNGDGVLHLNRVVHHDRGRQWRTGDSRLCCSDTPSGYYTSHVIYYTPWSSPSPGSHPCLKRCKRVCIIIIHRPFVRSNLIVLGNPQSAQHAAASSGAAGLPGQRRRMRRAAGLGSFRWRWPRQQVGTAQPDPPDAATMSKVAYWLSNAALSVLSSGPGFTCLATDVGHCLSPLALSTRHVVCDLRDADRLLAQAEDLAVTGRRRLRANQ